MSQTSFTQIKAAFDADNSLGDFECIATPRRQNCDNKLLPDQKANAEPLLSIAQKDLSLNDVRDIINCLLCHEHQKTYRHKDKLEAQWTTEFPNLNFKLLRTSSPLSLYSRRPTSDGRRSSNLTPTPSTSRPTPATSLESSSPPPDFPAGRHQRGSGSPSLPSTPSIERNFRPRVTSEKPTGASTNDRDYSRSASRGCASLTRPLSDDFPSQAYKNGAGVSEIPDTTIPAIIDHNQASEQHNTDIEASQHDDKAETGLNPFAPGKTSEWSLRKVRSEVLALLSDPLPKADTTGDIYAVQVRSKPYVKIGITKRKVNRRLGEIEVQHGQDLDMNTVVRIAGVPISQLKRLEDLVHAYLARVRRDLRPHNSRSKGTRSEYFECDIGTAEKIMNRSWKLMKRVGLEPGRDIDYNVVDELRQDPALDMEMSDKLGMLTLN